jgi:Cu/Ag efflux protein CusF
MAAARLPRSHTLAYGSADIPAPQPAMQMAQHGAHEAHGMHSAHAATPEHQQTVVGEGRVIAVVPSSNQIVLDHKTITGFMDAMTMGYQVSPPALLEGVQAGDAVRFTIDMQHKAIINIEKMP